LEPVMATMTFNKAYASPPVILVTPGNAATQALGLYSAMTNTSPSPTFTINCVNAPASNQPSGTYHINYLVIGK
jgi:hypothetical protein